MLTLSVTQLNEYVKSLMNADPLLAELRLRGELSGFKRHSSGHLYFSLKDETSVVRCVMFRTYAQQSAPYNLRDGMRVTLTGNASVFVRDGSYQFYAAKMETEGIGALYQAYEALKRKLEAEGLFDPDRKRPIPAYPRRVGIVTSPTGAAVQDILRVARQRHAGIPLLLSPALVQGEAAAQSLIRALNRAARAQDVDVIILGRGGGSIEDLWAFNEEALARAVAACPVPVISAVGHETDFCICDFVADVRAATPSHAAAYAVPDRLALLGAVRLLQRRMARALFDRQALRQGAQRLKTRMVRAMTETLRARRAEILREKGKLRLLHPLATARMARVRVQTARRGLLRGAQGYLNDARMRTESARLRLEALSPDRVLGRGYALLERGEHVLTRAGDAQIGDELRVRLRDGALGVRVQTRQIHPEGEGV